MLKTKLRKQTGDTKRKAIAVLKRDRCVVEKACNGLFVNAVKSNEKVSLPSPVKLSSACKCEACFNPPVCFQTNQLRYFSTLVTHSKK